MIEKIPKEIIKIEDFNLSELIFLGSVLTHDEYGLQYYREVSANGIKTLDTDNSKALYNHFNAFIIQKLGGDKPDYFHVGTGKEYISHISAHERNFVNAYPLSFFQNK